ncbi:hypothetical protein MSPP1_000274 [Malassezia sp. CBS 17886]|nr:hypothetical protein MSPP1_000274 [Malassezia sp. CBS 17886]
MAILVPSPATSLLMAMGKPRLAAVEMAVAGDAENDDLLGADAEADDVDEDEYELHEHETVRELLSEQVICAAYLHRRSEKRKTWKKRWAVLRSSRLAFYKNDKEYALLKVVNANEIRAVVPIDFKRVGLTIGVVTPTRMFYLRADDSATTETWFARLEEVRKLHAECATGPPDTHASLSAQPTLPAARAAAGRRVESATMPVPPVAHRAEAAPITIARASTLPAPNILQVCVDGPAPDGDVASAPPAHGDGSSLHWNVRDPLHAEPGSYDAAAAACGSGDGAYLSPHAPVLSSSDDDGDVEAGDVAMPLPALPGPAPASHALAPPGARTDAEEHDRVIAQGYLMKQSSRRNQWRKRWFILTLGTLYYTRSHMDVRAHRHLPTSMILDVMECDADVAAPFSPSIPLPGGTALSLRGFGSTSVGADDAGVASGTADPQAAPPLSHSPLGIHTLAQRRRKERTFKIVTPKRTFLLCAPTEEEEIRWLSALQTILNRQRSAPMGVRRASITTS